MALLTNCIPVVFTYTARSAHISKATHSTNWFATNGKPNEVAWPFFEHLNYSDLVVEFPGAQVHGYIERLRRIPNTVVEEKQRHIERVRHLFLYDMEGTGEDAFTMVLRQLIAALV